MKEAIWRLEGKFIALDCPIDHPFFRQTSEWRWMASERAIASHARACGKFFLSSDVSALSLSLSLSPLILTPPQSFRNFVAVRIDGVRSAEFALGRTRTDGVTTTKLSNTPRGSAGGVGFERQGGRGVRRRGACNSSSRPPQRPPDQLRSIPGCLSVS